ncbi:unnamed protein product [Calypogeia fissa]
MPLQRSLFSFYSRGASTPLKKPNEKTSLDAANSLFGEQSQTLRAESRVQESLSQQELIQRIQQKFVRKDHVVREKTGEASVSGASGPRIPGFKRIREVEQSSLVPAAAAPSPGVFNEKRARLIAALGADDCQSKGGEWEAAKARFEWMSPDRIRDGNKRRPGDPLYDARTLHIPDDVFRKLSASQKQYWAVKCQYLDAILFFKVGKFYELYELDAEIGHKELDWKLIVSGVGKCRQVGCPESGIDDAIQKLVSRGYKVGRMEQIETAAQARANGGPNVTVQRELTQVLTPSTMMDGNIRPEAVHLLALKEGACDEAGKEGNATMAIGFAFVDAAVGRFYVGSLRDDSARSALLTLLRQVAPQEVLYEIGGISDETRRALRRSISPGWLPVVLTPLQPNEDFMIPEDAILKFRSRHYFKGGADADWSSEGAVDPWPPALESIAERDLATSALGALACHLTRMKCDDELLPNGVLSPYEIYKGSLRLDGQTVDNLELLQNRTNGGKEGTLLGYLDSCVTQFGKRLLRRWICHPLQNVGDIMHRLDAVDELRSRSEVSFSIRGGLRKMPDLERLVARLWGLAACPMLGLVPLAARKVHKRRLKAFCSTVLGMRAACDLLQELGRLSLENEPFQSKLLRSAAILADSETTQDCLATLEACIDRRSKLPCLICQGQNFDNDEDELEAEAVTLTNLMNLFNENRVHWIKVVETLGQLDVLTSFAAAVDGSNGPTCRPQFIASKGPEKGGSVLTMKGLWHPYAVGGQGGCIVPNDLELGTNPELMLEPRALLLTGPNMGGKSTLLRATCLAVIMAQLGCFVPCESCILSPVDTIFTRLGASDHIMTGESTFMVECTETASILHHATSNSLVVLDELGRGTSTFDGYAIAYAVLHELVTNLNCRLMFATHYHHLTEEFGANPLVKLGHMACSFQPYPNASDLDNSDHAEGLLDKELVFLYKLKEGACPKSYGLQVAILAGIPVTVVQRAQEAANTIRTRVAVSSDNRRELTENEQIVQAIFSAVDADNLGGGSRGDPYVRLLSLWQKLGKNPKFREFT